MKWGFSTVGFCGRSSSRPRIDSEGIDPGQLSLEEELYRLVVLESAWAGRDKARASLYRERAEAILRQNQAEAYYDKGIAPLLQALGTTH